MGERKREHTNLTPYNQTLATLLSFGIIPNSGTPPPRLLWGWTVTQPKNTTQSMASKSKTLPSDIVAEKLFRAIVCFIGFSKGVHFNQLPWRKNSHNFCYKLKPGRLSSLTESQKFSFLLNMNSQSIHNTRSIIKTCRISARRLLTNRN